MPSRGCRVHHALHALVVARTLAFDGVGGEGERRPGEADERDVTGQIGEGTADGLGDVRRGFLGRRHREPLHVRRALHRPLKHRPNAGLVIQVQPHRDEHGQEVREHDGGVHAQDALRVEGGPRGEFRCGEEGEARRVALQGMVFRHVAPRLAVQPDGRVVRWLAAASLEEGGVQGAVRVGRGLAKRLLRSSRRPCRNRRS